MSEIEKSEDSFEAFKASLNQSDDTYRRFIDELEEESDRGAAIFAGTFFECTLKIILEELLNKVKSTQSLLEDATGGLNTFSAKINICFSLGYITQQEFQALNVIKKIRNQFAHNFAYKFSFEDQAIKSQCITLKQEFELLKDQHFQSGRQAFIEAVKHLHQRLVDRHYEVITFASPNFRIETYLNDPLAYQKVGREQQELEFLRRMYNEETKWGKR